MRDLAFDTHRVTGSTRPTRLPSVVMNEIDQIREGHYLQTQGCAAPGLLPQPLSPVALESRSTLASTDTRHSDTPSSLMSTESLGSTHTTLSVQSLSNRSSSISSVRGNQSCLKAHFDPHRSYNRSRVLEAARSENIATVCKLLIHISRTPEAQPEHTEQVKLLLQQGALFECTDSECLRTPLIWAVVTGREDLVEVFLEEGALVDTRDGWWDWTPVIWAIMENRPTILHALIQKGADLTAADGISLRTPLLWAAGIGSYYAAEVLLKGSPSLIHTRDKEGMTPLTRAYFEGHLETAQLFVESGDNPNVKIKSGSSLLAWTISAEDQDFARLLLKHGADARSTDKDGVSVLILAIQQHLPDIVELLINKGADVNCTDKNGLPALTVAAKDKGADLAGMLIRKGATIEAKDLDGVTALLWAVWRDDKKLVEMLVKAGADVTVADRDGVTVQAWAQTWAVWTGNKEIAGLVSPGG